jgi:U6 snRNA-associated Sm-like protein LSm8
MSERLASYIGQRVSITEADGRLIFGRLRGVDQYVNVVVDNAEMLLLSRSEPPRSVALGSTVIRGDAIAIIGLVNTTLEAAVDRSSLRG